MPRSCVSFVLSFLLLVLTAGCEKPVIVQGDDPDVPAGTEVEGGRRVRFSVLPVVYTAFENEAEPQSHARSRSQEDLSAVCTRLTLGVFNADGEKVGTMRNQQVGDKSFGTFDLTLADGSYTIVILAHSGDANFSGSTLNKLTANYKVTDTFCYCGIISVDADTDSQYTFELHRCVAKVHIVFTQPLADDVSKVQFTYTGGSSTLDATTGYGSVNSTQKESRTVTDHASPQFDIYTFPHADDGSLTIHVETLSASGESLQQKQLTGVPIRPNYVTLVEGDFFGENPDDGRGKITITIDDTWDGTIPFYF